MILLWSRGRTNPTAAALALLAICATLAAMSRM